MLAEAPAGLIVIRNDVEEVEVEKTQKMRVGTTFKADIRLSTVERISKNYEEMAPSLLCAQFVMACAFMMVRGTQLHTALYVRTLSLDACERSRLEVVCIFTQLCHGGS